MKPEFSQYILEKILNIKFHENPSSRSRIVPCGRAGGRTDRQTDRQTDRHDEANNRFSQFCERVKNGYKKLFVIPEGRNNLENMRLERRIQ